MTAGDLHEYLAFAERLARRAGEIARRYALDIGEVVSKDDNSSLTKADEEINQLVIDHVAAKYPDVGVLGEEQSARGEPTSGLLWVCDPIDGTIPFTLGMQISTFCLALLDDGCPVVGVVYDFFADKLFSAIKGFGVWRNGQPFEHSAASQPLPIVDVEWWHSSPGDAKSLLEKLHAKRYQTPNFVSFNNSCLLVASGTIAGAIYAGDKPWDVAAAKVILGELGLVVTDLHGNDQRYDRPIRGAIMSDGLLQKELL